MKKNYTKALLLFSILITILIIGCKRESVLDNPIGPILPPPTTVTIVNDLTQVTANVSGIVLDESNAPISSAVVTSGGATTTTNSNGMFIFQNISLSKENGSVTVVKTGYFKGIRSFRTTAGKNHTVRLQLMQKVLSGTVNAAAGGIINLNGGASIIFPAAAFVTSTGATYTGTVNVYSRWINPTAANLPFIIPGDLRGVSTNGAENILETYGMVGAELEDVNGNTLKIATGKKATISFPLPASLQASAPATIQLWHFDDATARWKENGTATKTGTTYSAQVDKFSFWNVDVGTTDFINLDYTLINATTNSPLVSTSTRIKRANGTYGYGITNNAGFVSGLVPKNESLALEVISGCNSVIYSQNVGPFSTNTGVGNISVSLLSSQYINFTGTLLNCSGAAVSNGYVSFFATGGYGTTYNANGAGLFSFTILNCSNNNIIYNYQGTDNSTSQQSIVSTGNATNGAVNLGNINTCATTLGTQVYAAGYESNGTLNIAKIWKNGVATNLSDGTKDAIAYSVDVVGSDVYVAGYESNGTIYIAKVWKNGIPMNLSNGINSAFAYSVKVIGSDVYVVGKEFIGSKNVAKIWKNGIATNLTDGTKNGSARSVAIDGSDVYVTGAEDDNLLISTAKIWKNGSVTNLSNGSLSNSPNQVIVSGTNTYVAGREYLSVNLNRAKFWKNGVATYLTDGTKDASAESFFISGVDLYAVGYQRNNSGKDVATIWKNGSPIALTDGSKDAQTSCIKLVGTDVYVAGGESNGTTYIAKIWKNGLPTVLTNGTNNAFVLSIVVN